MHIYISLWPPKLGIKLDPLHYTYRKWWWVPAVGFFWALHWIPFFTLLDAEKRKCSQKSWLEKEWSSAAFRNWGAVRKRVVLHNIMGYAMYALKLLSQSPSVLYKVIWLYSNHVSFLKQLSKFWRQNSNDQVRRRNCFSWRLLPKWEFSR